VSHANFCSNLKNSRFFKFWNYFSRITGALHVSTVMVIIRCFRKLLLKTAAPPPENTVPKHSLLYAPMPCTSVVLRAAVSGTGPVRPVLLCIMFPSTLLFRYSLTHGAEPFFRSCQLCSYSRTSQHIMEPGGSSPRSHKPYTGPYPQPDQFNPYHPILPL
jgi:hypothetical protein